MRKLFFWLCCAVFVLPLFGQAASLAQRGLALQQHGDLEAAAQAYQASLQQQPGQPGVLTNLGVIRARQGRFADAVAAYRSALKFDPGFGPARLNLALAFYKQGHIGQARKQLTTYRSSHGDDLRTALLLADCDLRLGDNAAVVALMTPWEQKAPDNLAIAYLLGTADLRSGLSAEGQRLIQVIMSHGDSAEVHMMLGDAYTHAHQLKQAAQEFARAAALDPTLPEVHQRLGLAYLRTGDSDAAFREFQLESKNHPDSFEATFYLGVLYKQRGDLTAALPCLIRAHAMRPEALEPVLQLGLLTYEQRHYRQARRYLETVVKQAPGSVQAHVVLGQIYYRLHLPKRGMAERKIVQQLNAERQKASILHREQVSEHLKPLAGVSSEGQPQ